MAEHEPGFYWVRLRYADGSGGDWEIAKLDAGTGLWTKCFPDSDEYTENDFTEIGERVERSLSIDRVGEALRRMSKEEQTLTLIKASYAVGGLQSRMPTAADYVRAQQIIWPEPQPITDAQKNGERWLVWYEPAVSPFDQATLAPPHKRHGGWVVAQWDGRSWIAGLKEMLFLDHEGILDEDRVTRYLPLPPDVKL